MTGRTNRVGNLAVGLMLNDTQFVAGLRQSVASQRRFGKSMRKSFGSIEQSAGRSLGNVRNLLLGLGGAAVLRSIISTASEFENLQLRLKYFEGGVDGANKKFDELRAHASKTAFSFRDITSGYLALRTANFNPTIEQIRLLGDLAAGSGLDIQRLSGALASASRGEFEPLKAFGIGASKNKDEITLTFGELTETVNNASDEILGAVLRMAGPKFDGAAEDLSKGLAGIISNFGDMTDALASAFARGGFAQAFGDLTRSATAGGNALTAVAGSLGAVAGVVIQVLPYLVPLAAGFVTAKLAIGGVSIATAFMGSQFVRTISRLLKMVGVLRTSTVVLIGLRAAMSAVGGPIGIVVGLLTAGAVAWGVFGSSSSQAMDGMDESAQSYLATLQEQNKTLGEMHEEKMAAFRAELVMEEAKAARLLATIEMMKADTAHVRGKAAQIKALEEQYKILTASILATGEALTKISNLPAAGAAGGGGSAGGASSGGASSGGASSGGASSGGAAETAAEKLPNKLVMAQKTAMIDMRREQERLTTELGDGIANALRVGAREGGRAMIDSLLMQVQNNLIGSLGQMIAQGIANGAGGGGGGWLGALAKIGMSYFGGSSAGISQGGGDAVYNGQRVPGFARGGQWEVTGKGGTDKSLQQFMATPGETVRVTPKGAGGRSGGAVVNMYITQNITRDDGDEDEESAVERLTMRVKAAIEDDKRRGSWT